MELPGDLEEWEEWRDVAGLGLHLVAADFDLCPGFVIDDADGVGFADDLPTFLVCDFQVVEDRLAGQQAGGEVFELECDVDGDLVFAAVGRAGWSRQGDRGAGLVPLFRSIHEDQLCLGETEVVAGEGADCYFGDGGDEGGSGGRDDFEGGGFVLLGDNEHVFVGRDGLTVDIVELDAIGSATEEAECKRSGGSYALLADELHFGLGAVVPSDSAADEGTIAHGTNGGHGFFEAADVAVGLDFFDLREAVGFGELQADLEAFDDEAFVDFGLASLGAIVFGGDEVLEALV